MTSVQEAVVRMVLMSYGLSMRMHLQRGSSWAVSGLHGSAGCVLLYPVFDRWRSRRCLVVGSCVGLRSSCCVLGVGGWSWNPSVEVGCGTWSCSWRLVVDDGITRQSLRCPRPVCQCDVIRSAICRMIGFRCAWADFAVGGCWIHGAVSSGTWGTSATMMASRTFLIFV